MPRTWEEKGVVYADTVVAGYGECFLDFWENDFDPAKATYLYAAKPV